MIGSRDPDEPGFNRALDALRPIGSLVKPFVYLVALAQPQRYSLATLIEDSTIDLPQAGGARWQPQNDDHETHGNVMLIDALVHSWNLATVHLGLRVGVDRVQRIPASSFGLGRDINPNPSLLLGAVDLSPYDVAQLYQYLADDGHALPLRALRGVLDAKGRPLTRYSASSPAPATTCKRRGSLPTRCSRSRSAAPRTRSRNPASAICTRPARPARATRSAIRGSPDSPARSWRSPGSAATTTNRPASWARPARFESGSSS